MATTRKPEVAYCGANARPRPRFAPVIKSVGIPAVPLRILLGRFCGGPVDKRASRSGSGHLRARRDWAVNAFPGTRLPCVRCGMEDSPHGRRDAPKESLCDA